MHQFHNFGAAALGFNGSHIPNPHTLHSSQQQQQQQVRRLALAAAAAATGATGLHIHRHGSIALPSMRHPGQQRQQLLLPKELAEVICGAVGEIVQVAVLYPLDTIKVRCQAGGLPVGAAVQQLMSSGGPASVFKQLYAGVVSASIASVAVGSLYYFTFCAAKRTAARLVANAEQCKPNTTAAAAAAARSNSDQQQQQHHYPHGAKVDYTHDPVLATVCCDEAAAAAAAATQCTAASSDAPEPSHQGKLQANIMAACAAALVGALVEAPLELFKHRAQAGQLQGNMLGHIFTALRTQGPGALYGSFFLPFCFKSLPFDIGELMTYSCLTDWKDLVKKSNAATAAAARSPPAATAAAPTEDSWEQQQQQQQLVLPLGSITAAAATSTQQQQQQQQQQGLSKVPDHVWDMAIGAAAGAAAVLLSHPNDCIKTVMETGGGAAAAAGSGAFGSAAAFVATGKQLVQQRGVRGGLMTGLAPRLVESVPSTMLYWLAVEGCCRVLEPYTAK